MTLRRIASSGFSATDDRRCGQQSAALPDPRRTGRVPSPSVRNRRHPVCRGGGASRAGFTASCARMGVEASVVAPNRRRHTRRNCSVTEDLDLGERAAIALAEKAGADLLLIDENAGRAEARRRNLRVTGTLGVLRAAAEGGLLDARAVVARLRTTNFYVDEALLKRSSVSGCEASAPPGGAPVVAPQRQRPVTASRPRPRAGSPYPAPSCPCRWTPLESARGR